MQAYMYEVSYVDSIATNIVTSDFTGPTRVWEKKLKLTTDREYAVA